MKGGKKEHLICYEIRMSCLLYFFLNVEVMKKKKFEIMS